MLQNIPKQTYYVKKPNEKQTSLRNNSFPTHAQLCKKIPIFGYIIPENG